VRLNRNDSIAKWGGLFFCVILSTAKDLARSAYWQAPNAGASVEILRYSNFRSE